MSPRDSSGEQPKDPAEGLDQIVAAARSQLREAAAHPAIRNDPTKLFLGGIATSLDTMQQIVHRMEQAPRQPISPETMTELGRTSLILLERQAGDLLRARMRKWALSLSIALFTVALGSFGLGWIAHGSALERECMARGSIQNAPGGKGRFCAFWLPQ
jgi:hypothetical protein